MQNDIFSFVKMFTCTKNLASLQLVNCSKLRRKYPNSTVQSEMLGNSVAQS